MTKEYLNIAEAAEVLGVSAHWLNNARCTGAGPKFIKFGTGRSSPIRYRKSDLDEWMAERVMASTAEVAQVTA